MPCDGGDEHQRRALHLPKRLVSEQRGHEPRARTACGERAHVSTGREELLRRAGHDDVANVRIQARVVDGAGEIAEELVVVAVRRRTVEDDDSDLAFFLESY